MLFRVSNVCSFFCAAALCMSCGLCSAQQSEGKQPKKYSLSELIDFQITLAERQVMGVAEAMPEDKYSFTPAGEGFKGVRSFAGQLRHIAATNCAAWESGSTLKCSVRVVDSNGPASVASKAQLLAFLRESFAVGHQAAKALTPANVGDVVANEEGGTSQRLLALTEGAAHDFNHYGQLVEYLRMNRIVPPLSR